MTLPNPPPFWQTRPLEAMTHEQWESLCDGCGKCCLHKLEDEDTAEVYPTAMACRLLDIHSGHCRDYGTRQQRVPACIKLHPRDIPDFHWLPQTCAYRLVAAGQPLPSWHPLLTGDPETVHQAGASVRGYARPEQSVPESEWADYIIPLEQL